MPQIEQIALRVKELGFTVYEAKAYISLLQNNPATRYELSKNSGVPRSAIYGVIKQLENMGAVNALYSKPEKYIPLPPEQLFNLLENRLKEKIESARESLKDIESNLLSDHLWNIVGFQNMIHKAREIISNAKQEIYLSIWNRELKYVKAELKKAKDRGVKITLFSFTGLDFEADYLYSYQLDEKKLDKIWAHKIILVADHQELLMGEADEKLPKKTAWTTNKAIVDIATNHIILDMTLYGLRMNTSIDEAVNTMQSSRSDELGELLHEKYPENPFMDAKEINKAVD
ncbi:MAG: TrmB family transcriptional regulator [Calditrichaceae bacterium]|nr:TrmB family transcriptional regulator [Calditrichaceae bacterium]MBN2708470.1 TrmB family transcriptional regulator [Calditrichaceae bacterium]RQV93083.1 MAG: TrmB family transcriptional regulator [Calditrichota bacterium]